MTTEQREKLQKYLSFDKDRIINFIETILKVKVDKLLSATAYYDNEKDIVYAFDVIIGREHIIIHCNSYKDGFN